MSKYFIENGSLSEAGLHLVSGIKNKLEEIITSDEIRYMSEAELRMIETHLHKLLGDTISNKLAARQQLQAKYQAMSDDEFYSYLKEKYGAMWRWLSLTPEELERVPPLTNEQIEKAIEEGRKARQAAEEATSYYIPNPGVRIT